jgi:oligopeptidase B
MVKKQTVWAVASVVVLAVIVAVGCGKVKVEPPVAKTDPKVDVRHGVEMVDQYYWLRDRDSSYVLDYLSAENEYAVNVMAHTNDLQKELFQEMKERIKETDLSVPVRHGDYYYYTREEEGKEYDIYCRKKGEDGEEEITLDLNKLAENQDYFLLGTYLISPDHNLLAYAYDTAGRERYMVRVKDLTTGELLPDVIENTDADLEWANDNKTLFYVTMDETLRSDKCWKHVLGDSEEDELVYHEQDEAFYLGLGKTRSEQYIFIKLGSAVTSEYRYLNADNPDGSFKVLEPRMQDVEYSVSHHGDYFYIVTNADDATNFKLVRTPVTEPGKKNWKAFVPYDPKVKIDDCETFKDYMVIDERVNGLPTFLVRNMSDGTTEPIEFEEAGYMIGVGKNPEFDTETFRFTYRSMITPRSVFDYNFRTKDRLPPMAWKCR